MIALPSLSTSHLRMLVVVRRQWYGIEDGRQFVVFLRHHWRHCPLGTHLPASVSPASRSLHLWLFPSLDHDAARFFLNDDLQLRHLDTSRLDLSEHRGVRGRAPDCTRGVAVAILCLEMCHQVLRESSMSSQQDLDGHIRLV